MKFIKRFGLLASIASLFGCDEEPRNIALDPNAPSGEVIPFDINQDGFDLLENMQGHWVGTNKVISTEYDWFAFDYRPISPSHIFGIHEGGSLGNLFTSFFVTDFKGVRTIMARNGGVLNGIYRTSYFVLDKVETRATDKYYRLVDAEGGEATMFMELRFDNQDQLFFNAYTSRLGSLTPTRHMTFKGTKSNPQLSTTAAQAVNFPQNAPAWDLSNGFNTNWFYVNPGASKPKSATFLAQGNDNKNVVELARESGDPITIEDHPYLGYLQLDIIRNSDIVDKTLFVNLSIDPLTDINGYMSSLEPFNTILHFPVLSEGENEFLFTYLHPGEYYVTVIADMNGDGTISEGDFTHPLMKVSISPEGQHQMTIDNITVEN